MHETPCIFYHEIIKLINVRDLLIFWMHFVIFAHRMPVYFTTLCTFAGANTDYSNKAITHDSPSSVIHLENYDDDHNLRRGSSQITVVDPYHPSLQRSAPSRRSSGADLFTRRTSGEVYHDDQFLPPSRKPSVEAVQPRRASVRHSPSSPDHHKDIPEEQLALDDDQQEKKSVSFEEEEEGKEERPQVTAHQRWLWAYNKIIMQLNVSNFILPCLVKSHKCATGILKETASRN